MRLLQVEKAFIRNKMAQVFALTVVVDYPLKVGTIVAIEFCHMLALIMNSSVTPQ